MSSMIANMAPPDASGDPDPGIVQAYKARLQALGCSRGLTGKCIRTILHLIPWLSASGTGIETLDTRVLHRFLNHDCACPGPRGYPLASNLYMRRLVLGWKALGHARRYRSEIVNYADDFCVAGKAPTADMLVAVKRLMDRLKLPINEQKTRCLRCPEEPINFLGHRIGRNYGLHGRPYIGTRPSKASVQSICRRISEQTAARHGDDEHRGHGKAPELDDLRVGELLPPRTGRPGLLGNQQPFDETAATVALPEAQGEKREVRALPEPPAVETPRPDPP